MRPKLEQMNIAVRARDLMAEGHSIQEASKILGVAATSIYRWAATSGIMLIRNKIRLLPPTVKLDCRNTCRIPQSYIVALGKQTKTGDKVKLKLCELDGKRYITLELA